MYIFLMAFSNSIFASENTNFDISRTFSVQLPFAVSNKVEMPSLKSKLFTVKDEKKDAQVFVVHNTPPTFANKYSVERYWKKSKAQTHAFDQKEKDLGCERTSARTYQCSRDVSQNGKFLSETIYWNTKSDLVLVRVSSLRSLADSRTILNKIKTVQNSRWPAGGVK